MAADKIVAEDLTITGSIGVVLTKIQLGKLYDRIGVAKETLSKGRYAEIFIDNRSFTEDEDAYFSKIADYAYAAFRNKAAESRGIESEEMEKYAQVRCPTDQWSGLTRDLSGTCVVREESGEDRTGRRGWRHKQGDKDGEGEGRDIGRGQSARD